MPRVEGSSPSLLASDRGMSNRPSYLSPCPAWDGQGTSDGSPRITPGLIMSFLPKDRLQDISSRLNMALPMIAEPYETHSAGAMSMRLLSALTDHELREIARGLKVSDEGRFIDLYRRLSLLC